MKIKLNFFPVQEYLQIKLFCHTNKKEWLCVCVCLCEIYRADSWTEFGTKTLWMLRMRSSGSISQIFIWNFHYLRIKPIYGAFYQIFALNYRNVCPIKYFYIILNCIALSFEWYHFNTYCRIYYIIVYKLFKSYRHNITQVQEYKTGKGREKYYYELINIISFVSTFPKMPHIIGKINKYSLFFVHWLS